MLLKHVELFLVDESGAVSVDWVLITASAVGLSIGALVTLTDPVSNMVNNTGNAINAQAVNTTTQ